ncbi:MAG: pre-peptidase C-terminal domain-containing protein [archaeon]|nr:pre-peptidase C-terminal domain-containing protein [archaeon]
MQNRIRVKFYKKVLSTSMLIIFAISLFILPVKPALGNSEVTIFSEDFEGVFPTDNDWTVADLDVNSGDDYWGTTDYKVHGGTHSGWCAQIGERSGVTQIFKEDFEEGFGDGINGWSVWDDNPAGTDAYWDDVDSDFGGEDTYSGNYKGYCAGFGYSGTSSSPSYRLNMDASMSRTLDLTDYDAAEVHFHHKLISADVPFDYGQVLVDGVEVARYDSQVLSWTHVNIILDAYVGSVIEITWNFHSDDMVTGKGWFIDLIVILGGISTDTPNSELHNYDIYMEAIMVNQIDLSDYTSATLGYDYWHDCETNYDYLYVETSSNGLVWDTEESYTGSSFGWQSDTVDLTPFAGSIVYIRFVFLSDYTISYFEGAYLDNIEVTGTPQDDAGTGGDAGDDFDTATEIDAGSYEGFVKSFDINDYYKIYVSAGNTIHVTMTPSVGSNLDLELYDPDEVLVEESTNTGDAEESISYTAEASGDHFISVHYVSGSSTYTLEIDIEDNIPPTLSITSPTSGAEVKSSSVPVAWTGSDLDSGIDHYEVKLDDGSWSDVGTALTYTFVNVPDGSHTIYVKAVDGADNSKIELVNLTVNTSLLLGPGWMDDIMIFAIIIIAIVVIVVAIVLVRRRKHPLPPPPPR